MINDPFDRDCPARQLMDFMGEKWVPAVLYRLRDGTLRPSDLTRLLPGISKKMLTQTLRNLERWGLVRRKVYPVVPPRVEYSLTALGERFTEPIELLSEWAETNKADVRKMTRRRIVRQTIDHELESAPFNPSKMNTL